MISIQAAAAAIWLASAAEILPAPEPTSIAIDAGQVAPEPAAMAAVPPLILRRDTPIHFMVVSEVTTKTHLAGHRFKLRVDKPVVIDGVVVIPVGATAWGEVLTVKKSGNVGKAGSLEAKLLYVESGALQIPISGANAAKGAGGGGETALGVLALGPLGLFAKGNNAKIKAGELMTGFVEQDTELPRALPAGL
ncbi:hypothetical protein [Sphingopyxis macrogoltabida]|uniref:Uncharacterized protein n=1 Tax=Sphingopyxis macrogoltabida TaxID=33050 RepID=A0AAC8YXG9_SPHMC|nr:hypothetical protein [Sphingopyxis macrogoltabida]ALJ11865.1 hypothetical protein LH19_03190 [Sphingopyxis macrogoltabida]AMU88050.1 hypothetical protein ATM17_03160 [Sphingopyxis macrogoltabida]